MLISFERGRWAESTRTCYAINWRDFEAYCRDTAAVALPAEPETIAGYLLAREASHSTSSLSQRLAAIVAAHGLHGYDVPVKKTVIRDAWAEIRRRKGSAKTPKAALAGEDIKRLVRGIPPERLQDRAIVLIGYASLMRRSELVALNVEDLTFSRNDLTIKIHRSKTDKEGKGETVAILRSQTEYCAVAALEKWLAAREIKSGPIFRIGDHRMPPRGVATIVKKWAKRAGLDPAVIGAHSLRRGGITTMFRNGAKIEDIMRVSRHRTHAIALGYVEAPRASANPALRALGL
jgi:site-specific recombinase XerD